jgi:hypothetical protein
MADEAELGFHAGSLAIAHGIGIGGRGVGLVAPFLAPEVDLLVASSASRRRLLAAAFGLEAL